MKSLKDQGILSEANELDIRNSSIKFVVNLITELKKRLPENYKILKLVKLLSVENTLKPKNHNLLPLLEIFNDSAGNNPFKDLAKFAIEMLSLPWSNADVERVFSQLNVVKTKLRNRLITDTVNAVLHVRYGLKLNNKCWYNYEVPKSVVHKIGTNSTYESTNTEDWLTIFN
ncbi:hypothetical protein FF38_00083 [Lucilia cuprina]|uniref:HAT C-terminal dimerisation domain-containing protein n=1 Tax=Lucilia cuprina TaxID=7375 RepID=A0A0L0BNC1_LUCCU|nr:hypothetical protein FF38_00083 [Lucilia cuprina]